MKIHMRTFWCHAVALDNAVYWLWFFGGGSACHCNNFGSLHVACGRVILTKQSPWENLHVIWVAISPQMQDSFRERKNEVHYIYFPPTCAQYYSPFWDRNWCKYCSFIVRNGPATASNCKSITSLPNAKVPHVEHKFCRLSFLFSFSPKHQQSSWLETPPQLFEMTFPCLLPTQRKNAPPTALHHSFLFSRHVDLLMSMHSMFLYTHLHCFYSTAKRSQYNVGSCKLVPKVKAKGNGIHKSERLIVNETSRARQIALPGASPLACIPTWDK